MCLGGLDLAFEIADFGPLQGELLAEIRLFGARGREFRLEDFMGGTELVEFAPRFRVPFLDGLQFCLSLGLSGLGVFILRMARYRKGEQDGSNRKGPDRRVDPTTPGRCVNRWLVHDS